MDNRHVIASLLFSLSSMSDMVYKKKPFTSVHRRRACLARLLFQQGIEHVWRKNLFIKGDLNFLRLAEKEKCV